MAQQNSDTFEIHQRTRTMSETDKKCDSCGGTMDFDPNSGGLLCPYCGATKEIEQSEEISAKELDFESAELYDNCDWGVEKKTVLCKSCGAQSVYDQLQISDECPYCGSNQVMEEKGVNTLAPGGVCVFKIDKKRAGDLFKNWLKKKWFCPSEAKRKAKPDSFKGVYLPYWTFDTNTFSTYTAQYGRNRTVRDSKGNTRTVTDWYNTSGSYSEFIDDQLIIATTRHPHKILSRIEPFMTEDNLVYKPEYVAGFISERYAVGLKEGWEKAKAFIRRRLESNVTSKIRVENAASAVRGLRMHTHYNDIKYKYLLLPVWVSAFKYKNKIYEFMVNGQTGRVGGNAPVSPWRVLLAILIGLAIAGIIYFISWYIN